MQLTQVALGSERLEQHGQGHRLTLTLTTAPGTHTPA